MDFPTGKNAKLKTAIIIGVMLALYANAIYDVGCRKKQDPCRGV